MNTKTDKQNFTLPQGLTLGKNYQILRQIGKRGMGSVYLAYDIKLDLQVAIKVISPRVLANGRRARI